MSYIKDASIILPSIYLSRIKNIYINYIQDRQDLGFLCVRDIEDGNQITIIFKKGIFSITIIILTNFTLPNQELNTQSYSIINQSYSNKSCCTRLISSKNYHNLGLNVQDNLSSINLITKLRSGGDELPENPDQTFQKLNETLKESLRFDKLQNNLVSKSRESSGIFNNKSLNKIFIGILDKLEPVIGNPKFFRLLSETQKPLKSQLSVSVQSSFKDNRKIEKNSAKKSSSFFVEGLIPINPGRLPAFTAGSSMASDMEGFKDKIQSPIYNLLVAKEYLETSPSDAQWRYRFWKVVEDTLKINIASEVAGNVGSFMAGAAANKISDGYMTEMVLTEKTKNTQEKLNLEIFKQIAHEQGKNVSEVRGTGTIREFVPDFMRRDSGNVQNKTHVQIPGKILLIHLKIRHLLIKFNGFE
jgi:hypothetical protein